jgi:hypothetical protein
VFKRIDLVRISAQRKGREEVMSALGIAEIIAQTRYSKQANTRDIERQRAM